MSTIKTMLSILSFVVLSLSIPTICISFFIFFISLLLSAQYIATMSLIIFVVSVLIFTISFSMINRGIAKELDEYEDDKLKNCLNHY